jgi:acetolactate synthase small subunit
VSNALDLCKLLGHMNVTGDEDLERARKQLEAALSRVEVDDIKGSPAMRTHVKNKLDSILGQFDW